jgi:hypothetical protein
MQLLAIYAGHQCPNASMTVLGGERPAASALGLYKPGRSTPLPDIATIATMTGRWPFSRKTKHDHEASGSAYEARRRMPPPPLPRTAPTGAASSPRAPLCRSASRPPCDRVYVCVRQARRLYEHGQPVPWPNVNLPARWHLNSHRVPVAAGPTGRAETRPRDTPAACPF